MVEPGEVLMREATGVDSVDGGGGLSETNGFGRAECPPRKIGHEHRRDAVADLGPGDVGGDDMWRGDAPPARMAQSFHFPLWCDRFVVEASGPDVAPKHEARAVGKAETVYRR